MSVVFDYVDDSGVVNEFKFAKDIREEKLSVEEIYDVLIYLNAVGNVGINPMLLTDFYKISHRIIYKENTKKIYSALIARSDKYMPTAKGKMVVTGVQAVVKKYLINYFKKMFFGRPKEIVIAEYKFIVGNSLFIPYEEVDVKHLEDLHDLGYLPIRLSALKEGTRAPLQVPVVVLENTHDDFFWVTNYLETLLSSELWLSMTSATSAIALREMLDEFAIKTVGNTDGVAFQGHDFSFRGMGGVEAAMLSGMGHLLAFDGTDMVPVIQYLMMYYGANPAKELVGTSIPATEHSVMSASTSADGDRDEYDSYRRIITEKYPKGLISIVSDTYDFWRVVTETLPRLKAEIMSRDGKVVIRPDSGDPVDIICGRMQVEDLSDNKYVKTLSDAEGYHEDDIREMALEACEGRGNQGDDEYSVKFKYDGKLYESFYEVEYNRHDKTYYYVETVNFKRMEELEITAEDKGLIECLWEIFGGTINELGYKVLDSHIGAIYGDSITHERAKLINERLMEKGFASTNVVYGIGSFSYTYVTRDSLGMAVKALYAVVGDEEVKLFKDPKTDVGKRSLRGRVYVYEEDGVIKAKDNLFQADEDALNAVTPNMLEVVFEDGVLVNETSLSEIRARLRTS